MNLFKHPAVTTTSTPSFDRFVQVCGDPNDSSQALETIKAMLNDETIEQRINDSSKIDGETPLTEACKHGNTSIVSYLLDCGAAPDAANEKGETPFEIAKNENDATIQAIIEDHQVVLLVKMAMG